MTILDIRPAGPADAAAVAAFLAGLSPDSRWLRYHTPMPVIKSWLVDAVVRDVPDRHRSLLAWSGGRIVGIAEWGRLDPGDPVAEVGIVVDDAHRRQGIAKALLRALTEDGREHGVDMFAASVLSTNRPTIALLERLAPQRESRFDGTTVEVAIPLYRATA